MPKRRYTGGGIFFDEATNTYTTLGKGLMVFGFIAVIGVFIYGIVMAVIDSKPTTSSAKPPSPSPTPSYPVAPPESDLPGRIKIADIVQSPSSGQAIIYFDKRDPEGTTCSDCSTTFDVNVEYVGGDSYPAMYKKLTSPTLSGTLTFDYSVQTEGKALPTKINVKVVGRSVSSKDPNNTGGPATFKKTLPYV